MLLLYGVQYGLWASCEGVLPRINSITSFLNLILLPVTSSFLKNLGKICMSSLQIWEQALLQLSYEFFCKVLLSFFFVVISLRQQKYTAESSSCDDNMMSLIIFVAFWNFTKFWPSVASASALCAVWGKSSPHMENFCTIQYKTYKPSVIGTVQFLNLALLTNCWWLELNDLGQSGSCKQKK